MQCIQSIKSSMPKKKTFTKHLLLLSKSGLFVNRTMHFVFKAIFNPRAVLHTSLLQGFRIKLAWLLYTVSYLN